MYMFIIVLALMLVFYSVYRICYKKGKGITNTIFLLTTSIVLYVVIYDGILKMLNVHNSL